MKNLTQGMKVEREHKDLYKLIRNCHSPCRISQRKFYGMIAKAHLREHKDYYKKLKRAGL